MPKQTKSLTAPVKVGNLASLSSLERLSLRETITQWEAVEWKRRYRKKILEEGKKEAFYWWQGVIEDIGKRRGKKAADELRTRMNTLKESND
ncbi:hypothetical protein UFOVP21_45 [uncultured Caudovirales phage]|uniref:Uncharacterized protein n=1 Tax=uncultured Caudovirales phage TaxID=2100421 RepID=A0A6J5KI09_9CAUD|nr:hypothetical protein UFOVP21_45 [uncultured Caudovirales phage]